MTYARNSRLAAYQSVSVHGAVADADPHALVLMLMDGAAQRIAAARGCVERGETVRQAKLLHSCVTIVGELRGVLNLGAGGPLAHNLSDLYEYMIRRLLLANAKSDVSCINEVAHLLEDIRSAWVAIGPQVRSSPAASSPAAAPAISSMDSTANANASHGSAAKIASYGR